MLDLYVKKVIARNGEREVVPSSTEEMHNFIVEGIRPEFEDESVICIKFLQSCCDDDDDPEESPWYINPQVCHDEQGNANMMYGCFAYGPKMDSSFVPEILLISIPNTHIVLEKYDRFNTKLLIKGQSQLSDNEKLERFIKKYHYLQ